LPITDYYISKLYNFLKAVLRYLIWYSNCTAQYCSTWFGSGLPPWYIFGEEMWEIYSDVAALPASLIMVLWFSCTNYY